VRGQPEILIVDSDFTVLSRLNEMLSASDHQVELASSLAEAREKLADGNFGCVVVDRKLRDGSGLELLSEIKYSDPAKEVIIITAYANVQSAIDALRLGAADYITKPFDAYVEVVHRIEKSLEQWRMKAEMERLVADLYASNESLVAAQENTRLAYRETLLRLAVIAEFRDADTSRHLQRMALYSRTLAQAVGRSADYLEHIYDASPLHDIGKIGIPDAILQKPGKLAPEEWEVMKTHTTIGGRILEGTRSQVLALGGELALSHHERWDGSGYPRGLRGEEIPLSGRIVAVADVFDALTSKRCYKPAFRFEDSLALMRRQAGSHFDPRLVDVLGDCLASFHRIFIENREHGTVEEDMPPGITT
jgi:putative two-component system response regulator